MLRRFAAQLMMLTCVFGLHQAHAQELRDPTVAPAQTTGRASPLSAKPQGVDPGALSVIVRDGRRYLVHETRLFTQGQKIGEARIERISETEVWLKEDGVVRKLQLFPGIEVRKLPPKLPLPVRSIGSSPSYIPSSPTAACDFISSRCSSQEREKYSP